MDQGLTLSINCDISNIYITFLIVYEFLYFIP